MTRKKRNKKIITTILSIIIFIIAFILLINKNTSNQGDIKETSFNITPEYQKRIVLEDMDSIYKRYFVIYLDNTDNTYIVHSFNYYNTQSQYELEFHRLKEKILDYNINEYYIRYVYSDGFGSYNDVLNNLENITDSRNIKVYD